jgi:putative ABC transport system substrate-binding protein
MNRFLPKSFKSAIPIRKWVGLSVIGSVLVMTGPLAQAQQSKKAPLIGAVMGTSPSFSQPYIEAGRRAFRELGYVEGQNLRVEMRFGDGQPERLPDLAAELVKLNVDLIVAAGDPAIAAARRTTSTIPIVMVAAGDPVGAGWAASLAHPGGNMTGTTFLSSELAGKRLELLKDIFPQASRVAVLWNPNNPGWLPDVTETKIAGEQLGLKLQFVEARNLKELEGAFAAMIKEKATGLIVLSDPWFFGRERRQRIVEFATKNRLPSMYELREFVDDGGLMSYGPSLFNMVERSAYHVDKILKGAKPADLPVERPTKFELVVNLKTAKQIALTIPANVLARADKVIK